MIFSVVPMMCIAFIVDTPHVAKNVQRICTTSTDSAVSSAGRGFDQH